MFATKMSDYIPPISVPIPTPGFTEAPSELMIEATSDLVKVPFAQLMPPKLPLNGVPVIIPRGYGCVVMMGLGSVVLLAWKSMKVFFARREYDVPEPWEYSEAHMEFNCVYRAYQASIQIYPQFFFWLMFGGLCMPYLCALGGLTWLVGRRNYAREYYYLTPWKRHNGSAHVLGQLFCAFSTLMFVQHRWQMPF